MPHILDQLCAVIDQRKRDRPENSYVVRLLDGGRTATGAKVLEEAAELAEATEEGAVAHEAADLIFHTLVLLAEAGVPAERVWQELDRRFGTSGLEEKARRSHDGD